MTTFAGTVTVPVEPDTSDFGRKVEADALAAAERAAQKIGRVMGQVIADKIANGTQQGIDRASGTAAGRRVGAEFGRTFATTANAEIKAKLKDQQQVRVRVLADTSKARAEIDGFAKASGDRLGEKVSDGLKAGAEKGSREIPRQAPKAGEEYGGAFSRALKARLEAAFKSLPDVKLDTDSSRVDHAIAAIRKELQTLSGKRIGIDISDVEALRKIDELKARLQRLSTESADVAVYVNAKTALAELAAIDAGIRKLDGKKAKVKVDADTAGARAGLAGIGAEAFGSTSRVGMLVGAVLLLGPALVPIAAASAGAFAGIAMGAMAAAGAVGVLLLALWPVIQAVAAVTQAQGKQTTTARQSASSAISLANAHDALKAAQEGVTEAVRRGQQAQERATRAIEDARRAERDAAQAVLEAEQRLADARKQAAQDQADLAARIMQGKLDERQAVLDLQKAQLAYHQAMADPSASQAEREQASITFEQAKLHLAQIQMGNAELAQQQQDSTLQGVEGSKKVQDAKQGVIDAQQRQRDAEREVADAVKAAAEAQRQSARSVAQAQQQVIQAQRALQQASTSAGAAGGSALETMREKLAALTPEGRRFVMFLVGPMKSALEGLSAGAQRGFLPGLQSGMQALLPFIPAMTRAVESLARVLGGLAAEAGQALGGPWWREFFAWASGTMGPVLQMMGRTLGNFAQGLAGLFRALEPAAMQFGRGLLGISQAFAVFGRNAGQSKGFQQFLAYVIQVGPRVWEFFTALASALWNVLRAAAPIGGVILDLVTSALQFIASLDPGTLNLIVGGIAAVAAGWVVLNVVMAANPVGLVIAAIAALIAVLVVAYKRSETFREAVQTVWDALQRAIPVIMAAVMPALERMWTTIRTQVLPAMEAFAAAVAPIIAWLVDRLAPVVARVWAGIVTAIDGALKMISGIINVITALITGDWSRFWQGINQIVTGQLEFTKGILGAAFAAIQAQFIVISKTVGAIWGRMWQMMVDAAKTPIRFVIETVINRGIIDSWNRLAGWFGVGPVDHLPVPFAAAAVPTEEPGTGPGRAFAVGGPVWGPGTGTSDSIPAWLSNGEFVLRAAAVKRLGLRFLQMLNEADRLDISGDPSAFRVGRFAEGGPADARVNATKAWLPSTDPLPYIWGGVGPSGYDCSGLSGEVWNRVTGHPSYRRVFTTNTLLADPSRFGLKRGRGLLTFGVSDTHMDGNLAGLGFEARGRNAGILIGPSAKPTSMFPHEFFLADLGGGHDDARWLGIDPLHPVESLQRILASVLAPLSRITGTAWGQLLARMPHKAVDAVVQHAASLWSTKDALRRLVPRFAEGGLVGRPTLYDDGGWLQPGLTTVLNASSAPEPVFSSAQWDRLSQGGLVDKRPNLSVSVTNPVPETASESTTRMMRRLSYTRPDPYLAGV